MPFNTDDRLVAELGRTFGDYMGTFTSERGQVRADVFRRGNAVEAHVSFPTGLNATAVTDRYVAELARYARERGFEGRVRLILS